MNSKTKILFLALSLVVALVAFGIRAEAVPVIYSALDPGAGAGDPRPNSDAAAAAFDTAVGPYNLITFEGLSNSNPIGLPGVTITLSNTASDVCAGICTQTATHLGYNTTSGGSTHLRVVPFFSGSDVVVTFAFANPIDFFGAYLTGTETDYNGEISITFDDGTSQSFSVPKNPHGGGVQFFGFTDFGKLISSVLYVEKGPFTSRDIWGIDDVRYGKTASVPEPGTLLLLGSGLVGLAGLTRKYTK